MINSVIAYN